MSKSQLDGRNFANLMGSAKADGRINLQSVREVQCIIDVFSNNGKGPIGVFSTVDEGRSADVSGCVFGADVAGVLSLGKAFGSSSLRGAEMNYPAASSGVSRRS